MRRMGAAMWLMLATGCVGAGGLQLQLAERHGPLEYAYASKEVGQRPGAVGVASYTVSGGLPTELTVQRKGGYVVPLLFFNFWKNEYAATLGAQQVTNDYVQVMKDSLAEELRRNGRVALAQQEGDLQLDVTVSKIEVKAPVVETGQAYFLLIGWGFGIDLKAAPAEVVITGEVVGRRGGQEVLRKAVVGRAVAAIRPSKKKFKIGDYTPTMIAGLSGAISNFNMAVVSEVNGI